MDFLNRAFAQTSDLFRSMTPAARLLAGLMLAVVVVSAGWLFRHQMHGGEAYLMGGRAFSADELPAMEAAFAKAGLTAYEIEGNRIRIPRGQHARYMGALAEGDALPVGLYTYLDKAVENIKGPLTDRNQREEILHNAKQKELATIIRSMSGIENAVVHYDTKRRGVWKGNDISTASVTVKPRGNQPLERTRVMAIRHLVASSYAGLAPQQVTVIDHNGRAYPAGSPEDAGGFGESRHLELTQQYEEDYRNKVLNALSFIPGVTVDANVELDTKLRHSEEKVKVDPKPIEVSTSEESRTESTTSAPPGGRPGVQAQAPGANQAVTLASNTSAANRSESETSSRRGQAVVSHDRTVTEEIGLTPRRVTTAIGIPASYFVEIWHKLHPAPAGQSRPTPDPNELKQIETEQITSIKEHIGLLLPRPVGVVDPVPLVTVTTFQDGLNVREETPTQSSELMLGFLSENWSTLGMILLGLISLMMLRSMLKASPPEQASSTILSTTVTADGRVVPVGAAGGGGSAEEEEEGEGEGRKGKRFGKSTSPRDELTELVRSDPDAAASILKAWIGNVT